MAIEKVHGQLCWTLESDTAKVSLTIQSGNLTCDFALGDRTVNPYYVFPWWKEPVSLTLDNLFQGMRGDFFCFPFGADDGEPVTYHGPTASGYWEPLGDARADENALDLRIELAQGEVTKHIELRPGESVIYQKHTVSGFDGAMPFGYHPILAFPDAPGSGLLSLSSSRGYTAPTPIETADTGGFSCLKPDCEIKDMTMAPCADGSTVDLTSYPHAHLHEDIAMFIADAEQPLAWSAVSYPAEGYLYFQLKDPSVLRQTVLWMSNGGRWYSPWNGRIRGVMGLEEVTSFFHYGQAASAQPNFLSDDGVETCRTFSADENVDISLISGVAAIGSDFGRVTRIEGTDNGEVTIVGEHSAEITVRCDTGFLK